MNCILNYSTCIKKEKTKNYRLMATESNKLNKQHCTKD